MDKRRCNQLCLHVSYLGGPRDGRCSGTTVSTGLEAGAWRRRGLGYDATRGHVSGMSWGCSVIRVVF